MIPGFSSVCTHHVGRKWVQMLSVSLFIWKLLRMQSRAELWGWRYPEMMQSSLNTWGPHSTPDERSTHPSDICHHYKKKNQNRINVASQWSVESSSRTLDPGLRIGLTFGTWWMSKSWGSLRLSMSVGSLMAPLPFWYTSTSLARPPRQRTNHTG